MEINETIKICGSCASCPTITKVEEGIIIKDNYNGIVRLTKEESEKLKELLKYEYWNSK